MKIEPDAKRLQWIATNLQIVDKKARRHLLVPNVAQLMLHKSIQEQRCRNLPVRIRLLKSRQVGSSTWVQAEAFYDAYHKPNWSVLSVSMDAQRTDHIFQMTKTYHEGLPMSLRLPTKNTNRKELIYASPHHSRMLSQTAGVKGLARSFTPQFAHLSEVAWWEDADAQAGALDQAVPRHAGTTIIQETTAQGQGGYFYEGFLESVRRKRKHPDDFTGYQPVFIPWYLFPEYAVEPPEGVAWTKEEKLRRDQFQLTDAQLWWYRLKLEEVNNDHAFMMQEYPACLVGTQRIGTEAGIVPIKEVQAGQGSRGSVSDVWCSGEGRCICIRTSLGYALECTPEHRIATKDLPLAVTHEWVEAQNSLGHTVCLASPRFAVEPYVVRWYGPPCVQHEAVVTLDLARWLGYFMGDGSYYGGTLSIACTARDEDVVSDVAQLTTSLFAPPQMRRTGTNKGCTEVRVGCKPALGLLRSIDAVRQNRKTYWKRHVCVPECIWRSPREMVREFLRGLFEADGFADKHVARVVLFAKNIDFLHDVQLLLLGFGIRCRVSSRRAVNGSGRSYGANTLELRKAESLLFMREIGFVSARKNRRQQWRYHRKTCGQQQAGNELLDTVVSIEEIGEHAVYDLESGADNAFDASGILVHNSYLEAFIASGSPVFAAEIVQTQTLYLGQLFKRVLYDETSASITPEPVQEEENCWLIHREPVENHDYVLGVDTMEGKVSDQKSDRSKLDYDAMVMIDRNTGDCVAMYHGRGDTQKELGQQAFRAAMVYNEAYIAPEIPQSMILLNYLKERGYPYLYNRQIHEDRLDESESEVLGWRTTALTRKWLVDDMVVACKEASIRLVFPEIVDEMRGFVRDKNGRPGHLPGEHDDLLFAAMIAWQAHQRCPLTPHPYAAGHTGDYHDDEDEDPLSALAVVGAVDDEMLPEEMDEYEDDDFWSTHTW